MYEVAFYVSDLLLTRTIDHCPDDSNKTEPQECGCGIAETDSDDDGTPDCNGALTSGFLC